MIDSQLCLLILTHFVGFEQIDNGKKLLLPTAVSIGKLVGIRDLLKKFENNNNNDNNLSSCEMKEMKEMKDDNNDVGWTCKKCTYINTSQSSICEMCSQRNPSQKNKNDKSINRNNNSNNNKDIKSLLVAMQLHMRSAQKSLDMQKRKVERWGRDMQRQFYLQRKADVSIQQNVVWICNQCRYVNPRNKTTCLKCFAEKTVSDNSSNDNTNINTNINTKISSFEMKLEQNGNDSSNNMDSKNDESSSNMNQMQEKSNFNPNLRFWKCKQCKLRNKYSFTKCRRCHVQKDTRIDHNVPPPKIHRRRRQKKLENTKVANNETKNNDDNDNKQMKMKMKNNSLRSDEQKKSANVFKLMMDKGMLNPENRALIEDSQQSELPLLIVFGQIDELRKQLQVSLTHKVE